MKHTPAPWAIQGEESALDGAMEYWVQNANGEDICSLNDMSIACLIAAAPDLLQALKKMLDAFHHDPLGGGQDAAVEAALDAIAKAEGK